MAIYSFVQKESWDRYAIWILAFKHMNFVMKDQVRCISWDFWLVLQLLPVPLPLVYLQLGHVKYLGQGPDLLLCPFGISFKLFFEKLFLVGLESLDARPVSNFRFEQVFERLKGSVDIVVRLPVISRLLPEEPLNVRILVDVDTHIILAHLLGAFICHGTFIQLLYFAVLIN